MLRDWSLAVSVGIGTFLILLFSRDYQAKNECELAGGFLVRTIYFSTVCIRPSAAYPRNPS